MDYIICQYMMQIIFSWSILNKRLRAYVNSTQAHLDSILWNEIDICICTILETRERFLPVTNQNRGFNNRDAERLHAKDQ